MLFDRLISRSLLIRTQLDLRGRNSPVQIAPSVDWPPIVQEDLYGSPIRHPSKNQQALFDHAIERRWCQCTGSLTDNDAKRQNRKTDCERASSDSEKLVQVQHNHFCTVSEIALQRGGEVAGTWRRALRFG